MLNLLVLSRSFLVHSARRRWTAASHWSSLLHTHRLECSANRVRTGIARGYGMTFRTVAVNLSLALGHDCEGTALSQMDTGHLHSAGQLSTQPGS
jgi:hypothetical protein